jgi:1,4-dihydroxy-2-naphthoyl-CoA hydrolase
MGDHSTIRFPAEFLKEWAGAGVNLPSLFTTPYLGSRLGIELTEASPERVVGTMPSVRSGLVTALHRGRSSATYEIALTDADDRRICSARLTCMVRGSVPGRPHNSAG